MLKKIITDFQPEISQIRQTIHAFPELKYEEFKTAELVAEHLQKWGYQIQTGIAKTGITTIIDSGKPGRTVALRADMDALPIIEQTNLSYSSKNSGKMHACGHDGHTATLLAVAATLARCKDQFKGKIKLIFQPAEEGGAGAAVMVKEGVLDGVDAIFGYHNMSLPLGKIAVKNGCIFSGADFFKIKIIGKSAHAAFPEKSIDPIFIGSQIVQALQSVVSRNIAATSSAVLSVTEFHAGNTINIIPGEASLTISLRTTSPEIRNKSLEHCEKISKGIAESYDAHIQIEKINNCPPTINTENEAQLVYNTAKKIFDKNNVMWLEHPTMATEDFAFFLEKIPGCFFLVGNGEDKSTLHTPTYNFSDEIIPVAAELLIMTAFDFLNID